MSNLIQLSSRQSPRTEREDAGVLEATQRLNDLVRQLSEIAHHVIASEAPEPLKYTIVQNLVGMQRHAHCISQHIIREYRSENRQSVRQASVHAPVSSAIALVSRE
jgi:hypothetical protein